MKRILDLGCGTGYRTYVLSKKRDTIVTGVDISKKNIKVAKKKYPKVDFRKMNVEKLRFERNFFDKVYAVDVLEHVDNLEAVLKEAARVTKKNGKLLAEIPSEKSEKWLLSKRPTFHKEIHHVRIFKDKDLENKLANYSFKIIKKKNKNFLQHLELYYSFKTKGLSSTQLDIGSWNDTALSIMVHIIVSFFDPYWVFNTHLKYVPFWIITLPVGYVVNYFGNKIMPKSVYYEFVKLT
jgi:ubiquinone/menaquinone biosynthesis C-methylase UbiE